MQIFQMNGQQAPTNNMTPELAHNLLIMEMCSNWSFVRWLMYRYRNGILKEIDEMENVWINFIKKHNINVELYKNEDEFLEQNLVPLVKEN